MLSRNLAVLGILTTGALGGAVVGPPSAREIDRPSGLETEPVNVVADPIVFGASLAIVEDTEAPRGFCTFCARCDPLQDKFSSDLNEEFNYWEGQPCINDVCQWHPNCEGFGALSPADMEKLDREIRTAWNAAVSNDIKAVQDAIVAHPSRITVNVARRSLQLLSCDGVSVIGHLPLSDTGLHALAGVASSS